MRCIVCGGIVRTLCAQTRDTQTCGYCRGNTHTPTRRPGQTGVKRIQ